MKYSTKRRLMITAGVVLLAGAIWMLNGCAWHGNASMVLEPHLKPSLCDIVD